MIVKCIKNKGSQLSDEERKYSGTIHTEFKLIINEQYNVYGIANWNGNFFFLTMNQYNTSPDWNPAGLFEVVDNSIPSNWFFSQISNSELKTIIGYHELVNIEDYYDDLVEREQYAMDIFFNRKEEIDKELSEKY